MKDEGGTRRHADAGTRGSVTSFAPRSRVALSPRPSSLLCGVAKLVRHRIVNPAIEGSNPSATARLITDWQLPIGRTELAVRPNGQSEIGNAIGNVVGPELE